MRLYRRKQNGKVPLYENPQSINTLLIGGLMTPELKRGNFGGGIDDIRIYDRALSEAEARALQSEKPKTDLKKGGPLLPFCGNAKDESGNGHDGTVNGATLTTDRHDKANNAYDFDGKSWIDLCNLKS